MLGNINRKRFMLKTFAVLFLVLGFSMAVAPYILAEISTMMNVNYYFH